MRTWCGATSARSAYSRSAASRRSGRSGTSTSGWARRSTRRSSSFGNAEEPSPPTLWRRALPERAPFPHAAVLGLDVEHDRHGPVVHELDLHVSGEDARLDRDAQ